LTGISSKLSRFFPGISLFGGYQREWLAGDLMAGVSGCVVMVPSVIAYARLMGMPPQTGLFAALVPLLVYPFLTTSPQVIVGPDIAICLLIVSAVGPLAAGRLGTPDIALFYATPGAMIYFINGLQWSGYKRFDWSVVGESACADSWGRALTTRQPSLSIPCFAERRYGGVLDDEMLMATPPEYLVSAIAGMRALAKNGFRYPFPQYGVQQDVRAGMAVSYPRAP